MNQLNKFLTVGKAVFLVLAIIYVGSLVDFIFKPFQALTGIILIPMLLAVFFYYLLRPLVKVLEGKKLRRTPAILLIYLVLVALVLAFWGGVWPPLKSQVTTMLQNVPSLLQMFDAKVTELEQSGFLAKILPGDSGLFSHFTEYLNKGFMLMSNYISNLFSAVSNVAIILFTFPIILFYMLKDGERFGKIIVRALPLRFRNRSTAILKEIDAALNNYILSRVMVNLALGVLMYLGFLIIGLPYALVLTFVAVLMNFIPYFGAIISSIPIVIIGLIESTSTGIWALIIILLAQQIQDNIIQPLIFGKSLEIHPITTTVLVLGVGNLFGIIGMLIIVPVYVVIKILAKHMYHLFLKEKWEGL